MTTDSRSDDDQETREQALAVTYLRVSTKEQAAKGGLAEGFSIPAQRDALNRKAADLDAIVVAEFVDAGESAKSADRPNLQRMLDYIEKNHVRYVLVHKVDRLARNRKDDVEINLRIAGAGATLVSATENIDETPTGKLMHGMLSTFAEFYSNNLATEVHKGMGQKARMGGTPGKAPLGYLNVGKLTEEGREVRTVVIDEERADYLSWAFKAYATGEWTLRTMADELETLGLRSRRTPKLPGKPVATNILNRILRNPYYKGIVVYQGVQYDGNHEPLVDAVTWQKVQDVLDGNSTGEKQRRYRHYLKSVVWCGRCGSRLVIQITTNHQGNIYPYFTCLGRQKKDIRCTRSAILIPKVERMVEDLWQTVQLPHGIREDLQRALHGELAASREAAELQRTQLLSEKTKLTNRRKRLMEAIYAGAVPLEEIAAEQETLSEQLAAVEARLQGAATEFAAVSDNLTKAIALVTDCGKAYLDAPDDVRRLFNQAFFDKLYIDDDGASGELAEPFASIRAEGVKILATNKAPVTPDVSGGRVLALTGAGAIPSVQGSQMTSLVRPAGFEPAT